MENSSFRRIYFLHVNFSDFKFSQIIAFVFRLYTAVFHTFYAFYRFYPPFHTFCILLVKSQTGLDDLLKLVGLPDTGKKKTKDFSLGMRQRLSIAFSLISNPDFLILDEPINGLDPEGIMEVRDLLIKLHNEREITILISSHILDELSKLATHYGFINEGTLIKEMSAEELERNCSKKISITVDSTRKLAPVLDQMGLIYTVLSETTAEIYSHIEVTPLVLALADKDCRVITMSEDNESLESYFIKLIGGIHNA